MPLRPTDPATHLVPPAGGTHSSIPRRQVFLLAAVWAIATTLLFIFRPGYLFPSTDNIDSWVYTGYQWDLRRHIREFGALYYGARLSWILPGAFLHSVLPPVAANVCLKLMVSALLAAAGSTVAYRALGFRAALVAAAVAVLAPQLIYALHTDYDIAVITYASLAVAGITLAKDSRVWPVWILFSGVMFTCMVVANLTSIGTPGLGIALFHLAWLRGGFRRLVTCLGLYAIAAIATLAGLGLASVMVGGDFLFMKPQFAMLRYLKGDEKNPWQPKDWRWLWEATWLIVPASALIWGFLRSYLAPSANVGAQLLVRALTWGLAVSLAVAAILELHGNPVLSLYYYSSFHLCLALPLLVVCFASSAPRNDTSWRFLLYSGAFLALVVIALDPLSLGQRLAHFFGVTHASNRLPITAGAMLLLLLVVSVVGAALRTKQLLRSLPCAEIALVGILGASIPIPFHSPELFSRPRERYASVHGAFDVVREKYPPDTYRFWEHPAQQGSRSLTSTWLWGYRLFSRKSFPDFEDGNMSSLGDRTLIITAPPGAGEATLAQARTALIGVAHIEHAEVLRLPGDAGTGFDLVALSLGDKFTGLDAVAADFNQAGALVALDARSEAGYGPALEKNLYGPGDRAAVALTSSDGITWFKRSDPRDHLATSFRKLGALSGASALIVSVDIRRAGQAVLVVQDETFQSLKQIPLRASGTHAYVVALPGNSRSIRLYFTSPTDAPVPLPTQVIVRTVPVPPKSAKSQ